METLGYREVMELLNVSKNTAYKILNDENVPILCSSPKRILKEDLIAYLKSKKA